MRRREFITLLGGAAATWPLVVRAQQSMPVIGFLGLESAGLLGRLGAFRQGLAETGFVEGRNVAIEYRWAENHDDRLPELAASLVRLQPVVIATGGGAGPALAAKAATTTIPIVFATGGDPVRLGLVTSFNQPSGNITGVSFLSNTIVPKQFEVLHEIARKSAAIGLLVNPSNPNSAPNVQDAKAAVEGLGRKVVVVRAGSESEFEPAFATLILQQVGGLVIDADSFFNSRVNQLAALAARYSLPAIFATRDFTEAGGLMSYGTNIVDAYREAGVYTGRVLKGAKPADLPVQQATRVELVLNLKTAKKLGITIPLPLLGRADEVIE